ncbi:porin [Hydrogenovibrio sp. 3SP14C1]|uniref:porin n=1 Tax=Hydrogenovibrio sp. 3SP14C1 TaxID=3038774 RepID=UPI0024180DC3|nr:porin [Hydrogenovibrio sp. 3SP14C1]MDG4811699.1 porin [Hydrogenovibrio sp. 3SP14C1]
MKKNIIALAVASAIAAPVAMADAPTVYGKLNQALESVSENGIQVNSRASRLGVKGSSDLGNGLKAVYKVEFSVGMADGSAIGNRNQYAGLAGGFGTVLMGRHDTPMKMIQSKDLFNDSHYGDDRRFNGGIGYLNRSGEVRANNVLAYVSPSFGGVKLIAAGVTEAQDNATAGTTNKDSSLTNVMSFAAAYGSKKKGLYLAAAYNTFDKKTGVDGSETRVTAQYVVAGLLANVSYNNADLKRTPGSSVAFTKASTISANIGYKMGNLMPKVKFATIDYDKTVQSKDSTSMAVGVDYKLGKKTTTYAEYLTVDKYNRQGANFNSTTIANGKSTDVISVGLIHKF